MKRLRILKLSKVKGAILKLLVLALGWSGTAWLSGRFLKMSNAPFQPTRSAAATRRLRLGLQQAGVRLHLVRCSVLARPSFTALLRLAVLCSHVFAFSEFETVLERLQVVAVGGEVLLIALQLFQCCLQNVHCYDPKKSATFAKVT